MEGRTDLTGMTFSRLRVLFKDSADSSGKRPWLCVCECGNLVRAYASDLRSGKVKSCGCLRRETARRQGKKNTIHGKTGTRIHGIWMAMRGRCNVSSNVSYSLYGGRGIKVCEAWNDFQAFYNWAIKNGYSNSLTLDRIDPNGDYAPENCRWATYKEQENNRRNNRKVKICGCEKNLSEWAEFVGINPQTLANRLEHQWPMDDLFMTPNLNNKNIRRKQNAE